MPTMNTDSRRRAAAAFTEKRKADGWAKVTVWLSPEALSALATLTKAHGSRDAALNAALSGGVVAAETIDEPKTKPLPKTTKKPIGFNLDGKPIYR